MADLEESDAVADGQGIDEPSYWRCSECGTVQLLPLPAVEENLAFESEEAAAEMAAADDLRREYFLRRLRRLGRAAAPDNRFLDIGCSTGRFLGLAHQAGWHVTGVEMSAPLAREARAHVPGARILTSDIMAENPAASDPLGKFHAIAALDVIEHVLHPAGLAQRLFELTEPGGRILLQTPNAASLRARLHGEQWNMLIPEYHFNLFTPPSIRLLLEDAGFADISITTVSGSGMEQGSAARGAAALKERLLALGLLGNALLVTACRRQSS